MALLSAFIGEQPWSKV